MRRRRRGGGAAPAEACGVWLDAAELKRSPARPLKAPTRVPDWKRSPVPLPTPRTRQTTILTFFGCPADEGDKENARPAPFPPDQDREHTGIPLAACPVKILPLPQLEGAREEPPGAGQGVQGTSRAWETPRDSLELHREPQSPSRASRGARGDSWCCSLSPGSEHSGIVTPRNKSRVFPRESSPGSRKAQHGSRADPGTENTNPGPGAAPGGVCSSQPLRERGQNLGGDLGGSCRDLFSQDSQGNRVIAHRDRGSSCGDPPSPGQPLEPGPESLFTQDSQGNRVIKHC